jgi:nucleoside-diphosphate-sugar epimerase
MGFIGLHVVKRLLDAGESVVVTWNHLSSRGTIPGECLSSGAMSSESG